MRYLGRIRDWNDAKGFGFVEPNGGGDRAFVHVKAFDRMARRPVDGDLVSYAVVRDARGRINARQVRHAAVRRRQPARKRWFPRKGAALLGFAALGVGWTTGWLPTPFAAAYAGMSALALLVYWHDKSAARAGRQRTSEATLHLLAMLGGWPGALLAQGLLRHKSSKTSFQWMFWATVIVNCVAVAWLL